jgi:hypothetical protein
MLSTKALLTVLLLSSTALAVPEPVDAHAIENVVRDASANAEAEPEAIDLAKRACKCQKVKNPGMYGSRRHACGMGSKMVDGRQVFTAVTAG